MKVLLVNGSPHKDGCIFTSLSEVAGALKNNGVDSEIFWIGNRAVQGCIACWKCRENGTRCVFKDQLYTDFVGKMKECDGIVIGAPVYYVVLREVSAQFSTGHFSPRRNIFNINLPHVWSTAAAEGQVQRSTD